MMNASLISTQVWLTPSSVGLGGSSTCVASATDHEGILAVGLEDVLQPCLDLVLCMACTLSVYAQASANLFQVADVDEADEAFSTMTFENGVHEKRTMILKNGGCMCPAVHQRCASAHGAPEAITVT